MDRSKAEILARLQQMVSSAKHSTPSPPATPATPPTFTTPSAPADTPTTAPPAVVRTQRSLAPAAAITPPAPPATPASPAGAVAAAKAPVPTKAQPTNLVQDILGEYSGGGDALEEEAEDEEGEYINMGEMFDTIKRMEQQLSATPKYVCEGVRDVLDFRILSTLQNMQSDLMFLTSHFQDLSAEVASIREDVNTLASILKLDEDAAEAEAEAEAEVEKATNTTLAATKVKANDASQRAQIRADSESDDEPDIGLNYSSPAEEKAETEADEYKPDYCDFQVSAPSKDEDAENWQDPEGCGVEVDSQPCPPSSKIRVCIGEQTIACLPEELAQHLQNFRLADLKAAYEKLNKGKLARNARKDAVCEQLAAAILEDS